MNPAPRSFLTYLTRSLSGLFLVTFAAILVWLYLSTDQAIRRQQNLNIGLNNRNSARVLEGLRHELMEALEQAVLHLTFSPQGEKPDFLSGPATGRHTHGAAASLDLLRVLDTQGKQLAAADSPFFDLSGIMPTSLSQLRHQLLDSTVLLPIQNNGERIWILASGKRIIHQTSGRILGVLVGGTVLNQDSPLMREMVARTGAEFAALLIEDQLVCSSSPLPPGLEERLRTTNMAIERLDLTIQGIVQSLVLSRQEIPLAKVGPGIFLLHFYRDTLQEETRRSFRVTGTFLLVTTIVLFLAFFLVSRRQIVHALDQLLGFTEKASELERNPVFQPGPFLEFNRVGEATEKMVGLLRSSQEDLARERERLSVTLRSIGDAVLSTDIEGRVVFLNKVAEELTGWSGEEAQGRPSTEIFHIVNEKTGERCACPVQRILKAGRILGLANHTVLVARNGRRWSIADSGAPIRDRESRVVGVVIVFRDVTLQRKVEEELLKVKKLQSIGLLAGGIAHDFNNILTAILGNMDLASHCISGENHEAQELLLEAKKATRRATKLTKQLLTFSQGGEPIKETTSLPELIRESSEFVLHGSKVSPEYLFPEDLWTVEADGGQLSQVIQNIVINAKQAMPEGGRVKIRCHNVEDPGSEALLSISEGQYVKITIEDTGIGIPREAKEKVFDPYFTTKQEGSGLGLAICHSIVNKHDGYITVNSVSGQGTTFSVYLPARASSGVVPSSPSERASSIRAARVMIMDDEELVRDVVSLMLTSLGHTVVPVTDGEHAVNRYQELQDQGDPVDVVILDLTVAGGMGGKEAAVRLLELDPEARLVVASGYSNDPVMSRYGDYGFRAAVEKPFDRAGLGKAIEAALG